ncbi:dephospho-CoA kinase [Alcanivorax hongdengensis A-11-3]|uniref:Dephospho-CoA kinase n=1 Tax=Alcanivorax hongdengensis A-11-3 TaxID=1177179 RepID=L0WBA8_9GAMM|nr:dephospho-CoA kinase [Alcanivorax hongdengensis]EKF74251.1 dephospho-CoA kinase [Alcanivorax hongdengensis A-11-3]
MYVVGLTGGIGSGKTAATDYLAQQGITIVDADLASRVVVEPGQPALAAIADHFGKGVIAEDGSLDRRALREIVFADADALKVLEGITHPAIGDELHRQIRASHSPYTILVSPLLLETSQKDLVDRILVIDAPATLQVERTMARDHVPEAQVAAIMKAQMQRDRRLDQADDVVENHGSLEQFHQQLDRLHRFYLEQAQ